MVLSEEKKNALIRRLLLARLRILNQNGFYGLLLMHMKFALTDQLDTAATDAEYIYFSPDFMEELNDAELDFILEHEILHVALLHCFRDGSREGERFNIACDIVVNSNILKEHDMNLHSITVGGGEPSMHLTPHKDEGYLYTAEEVYAMLPARKKKIPAALDDHSLWKWGDPDGRKDLWGQWVKDAVEAATTMDSSDSRGQIPAGVSRNLEKEKQVQTDWRVILNEFVQEEVTDYSFLPPDRRFDENPFFLPDYNEKESLVKDILFFIDTSGSVDDRLMTVAYSEVLGAIEQFGEKLSGWLGFFDAEVTKPKPFADRTEFRSIKPRGGGGTDFEILFRYVDRHMRETPPAAILILTDGYAPFPQEAMTQGIPVLWIINNEEVTPPWGKVVRITEDV